MTDLEWRELDEALARAMGWKRYIGAEIPEEHRERGTQEQEQIVWIAPGNKREACSWCGYGVTEWHASLDALLRDIEPVCRERGMKGYSFESLSWMPAERRCRAYTEPWDGVDFEGPTAATTLARAFLAVLTKGEM